MNPLHWESVLADLQSPFYSVVDCGPLYGPIHLHTFARNENLELVLETHSAGDSESSYQIPQSGTVEYTPGKVEFQGLYGSSATASGVAPTSHSRHFDSFQTKNVTIQSARIHSLIWKSSRNEEPSYTIEWLENLPNEYTWPHIVREARKSERLTEFFGDNFTIRMDDEGEEGGSSMACLHLNIHGVDLFVRRYLNTTIPGFTRPGIILYKGCPDAQFREKIRSALSFAFGQYLIYLGFTGFTEKWMAVVKEAVSPVTLGGAAMRNVTSPPAPVNVQYEWWIDPNLFQRQVVAVFDNYETYQMRGVLWGYWHGVVAPAHIAAVHFAAVFERLQKVFYESSASTSKHILGKELWKPLLKGFLSELNKVDVESGQKELLSNMLSMANTAPQRVQMARFLAELKIGTGRVEDRAWKDGRNRAAHGGEIQDSEYLQVIRDNKVLRILVNRVILSAFQAADSYHDYYTLGKPVTPLSLPIPDDRPES